MRRILAYALAAASVPVGIGIGLWMALLTDLPFCPGLGLGTLRLCAAQPRFSMALCVLCGAGAAAVILLASIALSPRVSNVAFIDVGAAAAGIVLGVWASRMVYASPLCGAPRQLCSNFLIQRFATWEDALIGLTATILIVVIGALVNPGYRLVNVRAARTMERWFFKDLSNAALIADPGSEAR
jgi:hypothetical protein